MNCDVFDLYPFPTRRSSDLWFEKNGVGSDLEARPVKITQRLNDRGHQVRTAPYGLGQEHIGTLAFLQAADVAYQVVKDRKSTRLNSRHAHNSYAGFCLKKKR